MTDFPSLFTIRLKSRVVFATAVLFGFVACGGEAFTSEGSGDGDSPGDGDSSGDGDSGGDGDAGDGDMVGDGDIVGDGDVVGDGDTGDGDGDPVSDSCEGNSECVLTSATCCGACGVPSVEDMTAIRVGEREAHQQEVCGDEPAICPLCASGRNPNLFAQCVQGTCEAHDLSRHGDSECTTTDECAVIPAACCECGAGTSYSEVVAINGSRAQGFRESQCVIDGGDPVACPECLWEPPTDLQAECVEGRCRLTGEGVPAND